MKSKLLILLPITLFFYNSQSIAADKDIEHIVVSGTKTNKLLSNSPVLVDVIDGETLKAISQGTLAKVLDFIPGVVVNRSVKDGYNIQMQGFGSKHVLILVDGQSLISPANSSVDLDHISASDIDQIEVIKGAASVLHGSSAMGGVINILTKKRQGSYASAFYETGSYLNNKPDTENGDSISQLLNLKAGTQWLGWQHNVKLQILKDTGFDYDEETISQNSAELKKKFVQLNSQKDIANISTTLSYQYFDELKTRPTSKIPGQEGYIYYTSDVAQHQLDFNLLPTDNKWKLNSRLIQHDETSGQSNSLRDTSIQFAEVEGLNVWQSGNTTPKVEGESGSETVFGVVTKFDGLDQIKPLTNSIEINGKNRHSIESYFQYNWISPKYQILAGVRGQNDSDFGFHSALRISGMAKMGDLENPVTLRLGVGQGYRVPDLKERHYIFDHSNLGYMVLGDENLTPEQANSITASLAYASQVLSDNADYSFEVSTHFSDTKDLISTVTDIEESAKEGLDISRYSNIESAKISGFDISNELTFNQWVAQLNYSYVDSNDQDDNRLGGRPRHQVKFNFGYDFLQWDIESLVYLVYQADEAVSSNYLDVENNAYTLVNVTINQFITSKLQWTLALNNIFDEHKSSSSSNQRHFDARPTSSRELRLGIEYKF
ncbi:hypothetical protein CJF42_16020 [Pseudoalteromonas sp. NBT06-2]|uniref:TonB-dependent receptor plug domain-containing protein n=1 Tax=Pseudoalteromonas sp. NBT06-2 TaxID=2025950 RepID=UPI000BA66822|nr:TonB-dependent receptor [Pseudoalteromonas sp. NBT06-2]PAJ73419.1 hypothetical protein CJF42_16020 [Pseudoalteromonas sp. NBT06-2]